MMGDENRFTDTRAEASRSSHEPATKGSPPSGGPYDPAWNRIGQIAGYLAATSFLLVIVLFLLDQLGILGSVPYKSTAAGALADEANFYAAYFAHQHQILWDIALRDTLGPLGYLAVMVIGLAVLNLAGPRRAVAQLVAASFVVGAIFASMNSLAFLGASEYWRSVGWTADPAAKMVAIGRDTEAIGLATQHMTNAGYLILAAGLVLVGQLARGGTLPSRMRYLAYGAAVLLGLLVLVSELRLDVVYNVLAIVSALVFPATLFWLGRHFGQLARA